MTLLNPSQQAGLQRAPASTETATAMSFLAIAPKTMRQINLFSLKLYLDSYLVTMTRKVATLMNGSDLVRVTIAVTKHYDQKVSWEEKGLFGFYFHITLHHGRKSVLGTQE